MKKIFVLFAAAAVFSLAACEKEKHAENLRVEYYADYEIIGGTPYILPIGTPWTDPGVKALCNGVDVTSQLVIDDQVADTVIGAYTVKYEYFTADGFSNFTTRTVYVCNPAVTTDLSGTYTSIAGTYRLRSGTQTLYPGFQVTIKKICPGFFEIDDMMAQFYEEYYGYGAKYDHVYDFSAEGYWSLNLDNSIDMVGGGYVGAWGDYAGPLTSASYDPANETISYVLTYGQNEFHVVLKKDN